MSVGQRGVDEGEASASIMAMWCTIRTFAKHARELGNQPLEEPVLFVKPEGCLHEDGPIPVSAHPGEVHHEVECVVRFGPDLNPVEVAVGLDLTDRLHQGLLRADQLPWSKAKCFRSSAVVGSWSPWTGSWDDLVDPAFGLQLTLSVNGDLRQQAPLHEMSIPPRQQVHALLAWAPVLANDMLFTGTPEGVGELLPGDHVVATLSNIEGEVLSVLDHRCA